MINNMNDIRVFFDDITSQVDINFRQKEIALASKIINKLEATYGIIDMVYIPNPVPKEKAKYIFVTMEPSFGRWARTKENAIIMLEKGFKNFLWSHDDMVFHYAINKYLDNSIYVTDISKIAMNVKNANEVRAKVYPFWINNLLEEIKLYGTDDYKVFFVGKQVQTWLEDYIDDEHIGATITHFSILAASKRNQIAKQNEIVYKSFISNELLDEECVLAFTKGLLEKTLCNKELSQEIYNRIASNKSFMNETRKKLIFAYYMAFQNIAH